MTATGFATETHDRARELRTQLATAVRQTASAIVPAQPDTPVAFIDVMGGCPTCGEPDGFHADGPHSTARAAIPPELTWKPGHKPAYQVAEDRRRDRMIAEWHDLPDDHPAARNTLHAYLGLTWIQYRAWVERR